MYCKNCGSKLVDNSKFCASCGMGIESTPTASPVVTQAAQDSSPVMPTNSTPIYILNQQQAPKQKHSQFLFITSLVFMILIAIRTFSTLNAAEEASALTEVDTGNYKLNLLLKDFHSSAAFCTVAILITLASVIAFFNIASASRKTAQTSQRKNKLGLALVVLSFIVLCASIVYLISEVTVINITTDIVALAESLGGFNPTDLAALKAQWSSAITGAVVFNITFITFSIINVVKSFMYRAVVKNEIKTNPVENITVPAIQ